MVFFRNALMDAISKTMYALLVFMHKIIPNWGICIILIGFLIYLVTYPLTMKGMMSMKKVQALQPKINKLRDQHKNWIVGCRPKKLIVKTIFGEVWHEALDC